jgi:hypothetical protein
LYDPAADAPTFIPALATALDRARRILGTSERTDIHDLQAVTRQATALDHQMRVILAAYDAQQAGAR